MLKKINTPTNCSNMNISFHCKNSTFLTNICKTGTLPSVAKIICKIFTKSQLTAIKLMTLSLLTNSPDMIPSDYWAQNTNWLNWLSSDQKNKQTNKQKKGDLNNICNLSLCDLSQCRQLAISQDLQLQPLPVWTTKTTALKLFKKLKIKVPPWKKRSTSFEAKVSTIWPNPPPEIVRTCYWLTYLWTCWSGPSGYAQCHGPLCYRISQFFFCVCVCVFVYSTF